MKTEKLKQRDLQVFSGCDLLIARGMVGNDGVCQELMKLMAGNVRHAFLNAASRVWLSRIERKVRICRAPA